METDNDVLTAERPLAFRILRTLHECAAIFREDLVEIFADHPDWEIKGALRGLEVVQLAKVYRYREFPSERDVEEWYPRDSPLWRFLSKEAGEFSQKTMGEALGVSQPIVSRRLKALIELGLVVVARTEGVKVTGGRRLWFRRA